MAAWISYIKQTGFSQIILNPKNKMVNQQNWQWKLQTISLRQPLCQKQALTQAFSCEFCKIFKNSFLTESFCVSASVALIETIHNQEFTQVHLTQVSLMLPFLLHTGKRPPQRPCSNTLLTSKKGLDFLKIKYLKNKNPARANKKPSFNWYLNKFWKGFLTFLTISD